MSGDWLLQSGARRRRWLWGLLSAGVLAAVLAINGPGMVSWYYRVRYDRIVDALPPVAAYTAVDRLLVLAPHPDDEGLSCAGSIQKASRAGAKVYIAWMTAGTGFEWDAILLNHRAHPGPDAMLGLGYRRIAEARDAAKVLGVSQDRLFFLCYPDGGLLHLFLDYYLQPYRSRYTGVDRVTFAEAVSPGAAFTGQNLEADLQRVIERVQPTLVLAPAPVDAHQDHRATSYVAMRVLGRRGEADKLRYWIVHGGLEWPVPKGWHPDLALEPPPRGHGLVWERVDLDPSEVEVKARAMRAHASQMLALRRFMEAFVRRNELLSRQPLPAELEDEPAEAAGAPG